MPASWGTGKRVLGEASLGPGKGLALLLRSHHMGQSVVLRGCSQWCVYGTMWNHVALVVESRVPAKDGF